jgi:hypothetical protein
MDRAKAKVESAAMMYSFKFRSAQWYAKSSDTIRLQRRSLGCGKLRLNLLTRMRLNYLRLFDTTAGCFIPVPTHQIS